MASKLSSVYPQRKKSRSAGDGKGAKGRPQAAKKKPSDGIHHSTLEEVSTATASLGSSRPQPAAFICGARMDIHNQDDGDDDDVEQTLRQFDMNLQYGPCLGMTRLERWERAQRLGLNPPVQVREILERASRAPACLWEGRV